MAKKYIELKKTIKICRNASDWNEENINDMNIKFTVEPSAFDDVVKTSNADDKQYSNVFNAAFENKIQM